MQTLTVQHFTIHRQGGIPNPDGGDSLERLTLTCAGHVLTQVTGVPGSRQNYVGLFTGMIQPNPQSSGSHIVDDALEKSIARTAAD